MELNTKKNNIFIKLLILPYRCIRKVIYIFNCIRSKFYKLPEKPTVVVCMDGGLCSQMLDYALGELFKRNGYVVKYDLQFFKDSGRDVFGNDARFLEINLLYPKLKIKKASTICIETFKKKCRTQESDILKCIQNKKNLYLVNDRPLILPIDELDKLRLELYSNPEPPKDKKNIKMAREIINCNESCAVHVRRGDLANFEIAKKCGYGNCTTDKYFVNSIKFLQKLHPDVFFYFFSDDLNYVINTLLPQFNNIKYKIVDINSDTVKNGGGYKDFYLISLCKHQICSLGSFGKEAARLNKNTNKIVISHKYISKLIKFQIILDYKGDFINSTIPYVKEMQ